MKKPSRQRSKVVLTRLKNYESHQVSQSLQKCLNLLGGLEKFVRPGSSVFVKINLLSPASPPEKGINTHPVFTKEILRFLKELNLAITVGDDFRADQNELLGS